jgi:DNA-binding transcriptional ArsR family regulator
MSEIVKVAQALADETRLNILTALLDGEATVNDLAARLELSQPRISTHLALLRAAGLVTVTQQGRQRTYSVAAKKVGKALAALQTLVATAEQPTRHDKHKEKGRKKAMNATLSTQAAREVQHDSAIRQARTCYDHLAGVAGVQLLDEMLKRGWLIKDSAAGRPTYQLTEAGTRALSERGVDLEAAAKARRAFAYGCLDWTERRSHLGGALGAAILAQMLAEGNIQPQTEGRTVRVIKPLQLWLNRAAS